MATEMDVTAQAIIRPRARVSGEARIASLSLPLVTGACWKDISPLQTSPQVGVERERPKASRSLVEYFLLRCCFHPRRRAEPVTNQVPRSLWPKRR